MLIRLGYELMFPCTGAGPDDGSCCYRHPSRAATFRQPDRLRTEPGSRSASSPTGSATAAAAFVAAGGTTAPVERHRRRGHRPARRRESQRPATCGGRLASRDLAVSAGQPLLRGRSAVRNRLAALRQTPPGWPRVQAICDWVHAATCSSATSLRVRPRRPTTSTPSGRAFAGTSCTWPSPSAAA